jgi:hypothetical protein
VFDVSRVREYWSDLDFVATDDVVEFHLARCRSCGAGGGRRHGVLAKLREEVSWVSMLVCGDCFGFLVNAEVPDCVGGGLGG